MIGRTVSHFRIVSKLGEGGMGVVYKAEDLTLGRTVALKFLPTDSQATEQDRSRLVHEARAAAALLHPNICPIYEVSEYEGRAFIAMAYIEGKSLRERMAEGPLSLDEALGIARQVGEALAAAHEKEVIHRDVKPANVMLTPEGRAILMDFGLAKVSGRTKLTVTGTTIGTLAYMSPEQVQGAAVDHRADVWALGVVLYEMVVGRPPFRDEYEAALLYSIVNTEPELLSRVRGGGKGGGAEALPAGLDGIVARALAKDPANRYQSARELVADLGVLAGDREALPAGRAKAVSSVHRVWRRWRVWERVAAVASVSLLAAVLVWAGYKFWPGQSEVIDSIGILPLQNLSGDARGEIWADGVTERLSASMGTIQALKKIVSDQTMKQFKGSNDPLPVIGRKVGVKALVEGSLMLVGDNVEITVKLYEASEDRQIWSNTFRGAAADIMLLQGQIVRAIAENLKAKLTPEGEARFAEVKRVEPEAYSAYLQGVRLNNDWALKPALEQFQRALRIDPTFAPACAGLAITYVNLALDYKIHPDEAAPLARAAAAQAVQLDDNSAEAHLASAWVKLNFDWDWDGADTEFKRALNISPNDGYVLGRYAFYLMFAGRTDESVAIARRIWEQHWGDLAWTYFYGRRYDDLIALVTKEHTDSREVAPEWDCFVLMAYVVKGRVEEALALSQKMEALSRVHQWDLAMVGYAYAVLGKRDKALGVLARLQELEQELKAGGGYLDSENLAIVYAGMGDKDRAFAALRKTVEIRQPAALQFPIEPFFDSLHSDPRWQELLQLIHYPKGKP